MLLISHALAGASFPAFEGLKANSPILPTVIMTNTEIAYIEGVSSSQIKKLVFSITKASEDESSMDFTVNNNINDEKSFFMFSKEDIENSKKDSKKCEITENKEYKFSELQTLCENLYNDMNTKITKFSKTLTVEYYSIYHILIQDGYTADSIPIEAANLLINLDKAKPTTSPIKSHLFKILYEKGIFIKNDKIISFLYDSSTNPISLNGDIDIERITNWIDKTDYTEITSKKYNIDTNTKVYSLSQNSNIIHYKGINDNNDNIFLHKIGESMSENDISTEITTQLTLIQKEIKDSYKQRIRMRNLDENKSFKEFKVDTVDSWYYEDVSSNYYKGYFIISEDFYYIEKTKSNNAKVLEKIVFEKKINNFANLILNDADVDMKITLQDQVEACSKDTPYKSYFYNIY